MTFWTIAANDLKLSLKDRMFFFWLLGFPLLFALIFGLAFPEYSPRGRKAALNILDKDNSFLSQALVGEFQGEKYDVSLIKKEEDKKIRTLIIPSNFQINILSGEKVELILEKEAESSQEASQSAYSQVLKAIIKTITRLVTLAPQNAEDLEARYDLLKMERLITLRTDLAGRLQSIPAGFNHFIPATTVMFILFTVLMYGGINLLQERRLGQLERSYLSPATFSSLIAGKWLSRLLLGLVQLVLLFVAGKILFKTYWGTSIPGIILVALFFCGTIAGMSILLGSLIRKEEVLVILNILLANLMAALGGCWFPQELFPSGLKKVSLAFPTGWTMDAFHKLVFFGSDLKSISINIIVLFLFTLAFLALAIRFFKLRKT